MLQLHVYTLLHRALSEINCLIPSLLYSPGKVELYSYTSKVIRYKGRQSRKKASMFPVLGIGGKMLWRCAASLAVLICLKGEPKRPGFPLTAGMWSTWCIWCRFVKVGREVEGKGVYILYHRRTSSFAYGVWESSCWHHDRACFCKCVQQRVCWSKVFRGTKQSHPN